MLLRTPTPIATNTGRRFRKPRIALYSHDALGLGHTRRNLLIAQALSRPPLNANVLLVTGAHNSNAFAIPSGVDMLTLPALYKEGNGQYRPRRFSFEADEFVTLRARTIRTAIEMFKPDVFIVDKVPRGVMGELHETLGYLRQHTETRCVLGLRDVLDHPKVIARQWQEAANIDAIRIYYDAVWVYGDPAVYNAAEEYHFPPDVKAKLTFTGYLDQAARVAWTESEDADHASPALPNEEFYLCVVGGGQDGWRLAELFASSLLPRNAAGLIVTGPFTPWVAWHKLHHLSAGHPRLHLQRFVAEPTVLYERAKRVVSMGGYNTVFELLSLEKRALVMPRIHPRKEQFIRAKRLRGLGLLDVMHPNKASSDAISQWLHRDLAPLHDVRDRIDMRGLSRIVDLTNALLPFAHQSHPKPQVRSAYAAS